MAIDVVMVIVMGGVAVVVIVLQDRPCCSQRCTSTVLSRVEETGPNNRSLRSPPCAHAAWVSAPRHWRISMISRATGPLTQTETRAYQPVATTQLRARFPQAVFDVN